MSRTPIPGPIRVNEFFPYRGGELHAEDVPIEQIAAAVGTPFYLYSAAGLAALYHRFAEAFAPAKPLVCYAVKANSNLAVLRVFARLGAGADVVSEGELRRALAAGIPPQRIIFSGLGKTRAELDAALAASIRQINVESIPELHRLSEVAAELAVHLRQAGPAVRRVDLGGGLGIRYHTETPPAPKDYARLVRGVFG